MARSQFQSRLNGTNLELMRSKRPSSFNWSMAVLMRSTSSTCLGLMTMCRPPVMSGPLRIVDFSPKGWSTVSCANDNAPSIGSTAASATPETSDYVMSAFVAASVVFQPMAFAWLACAEPLMTATLLREFPAVTEGLANQTLMD